MLIFGWTSMVDSGRSFSTSLKTNNFSGTQVRVLAPWPGGEGGWGRLALGGPRGGWRYLRDIFFLDKIFQCATQNVGWLDSFFQCATDLMNFQALGIIWHLGRKKIVVWGRVMSWPRYTTAERGSFFVCENVFHSHWTDLYWIKGTYGTSSPENHGVFTICRKPIISSHHS